MAANSENSSSNTTTAIQGNSTLKWLYLALAISGAILPWLANVDFIREYGSSFDLGMFVRLAHANPAASSLSRDLAIGATAVVIWIVQEGKRLQMRGLPWVLLSCVTLAFACGAPLFLYLRERRLEEIARVQEPKPTGQEIATSN